MCEEPASANLPTLFVRGHFRTGLANFEDARILQVTTTTNMYLFLAIIIWAYLFCLEFCASSQFQYEHCC